MENFLMCFLLDWRSVSYQAHIFYSPWVFTAYKKKIYIYKRQYAVYGCTILRITYIYNDLSSSKSSQSMRHLCQLDDPSL